MSAVPEAPATPAMLVVEAWSRVAELLDVLWAAKSPKELLDAVTSIETLRSTLDAVELMVVHEIEATNAAAHDGWASTKDFVTAVCGGGKASGPAAVRLASALTERRGVHAALADGWLSRAKAAVIVRAVDQLPVKTELRDRAETVLLEHARHLDATDLAKTGDRLIEVVDPDGDERRQERMLARDERAAHLDRFLSMTEDGAGGVRIKGRTTVEDAGVIKAALLPLAAPQPTTPRACGGITNCPDADCAHDGRDPRDHGARLIDALVEGCRLLQTSQVLPDCHGATPRLSLTMSYTDLVDRVGTATLETGETLSASAVRRLACDAELIPVVLGAQSEILDVGRTQRLVTSALWKALVVRDEHCSFPGCSRPPIACDAHHIEHWIDGGGTSLHNLALLCRAHHTMIHTTPWEIRLNGDDRRPEFLPPRRLDGHRRPIRRRHPRE